MNDHFKLEMSNDINEIALALSKFQGSLSPVTYDKSVDMNGFSKKTNKKYTINYKYLSFPELLRVTRKPLSDNELAFTQLPFSCNNKSFLITLLTHSSGQFFRGTMEIKNNVDDPQAMGSSMSYSKRYSLAGILGIAADDDDDGQMANIAREEKEQAALEKQQKIERELKEKKDLEIKTKISNIELRFEQCTNLDELSKTFNDLQPDLQYLRIHSKKDYAEMIVKKDKLKAELSK